LDTEHVTVLGLEAGGEMAVQTAATVFEPPEYVLVKTTVLVQLRGGGLVGRTWDRTAVKITVRPKVAEQLPAAQGVEGGVVVTTAEVITIENC